MAVAIQGVVDESVLIDEKLFTREKEKFVQHIIKPSEFLFTRNMILSL